MKPQKKILPFVSERDRLLNQAQHKLFYAVLLVRCEPTKSSLGIATALVKDVAGILDACLHFPAEPHLHHCPIDLAEFNRLVAEDQ
jgi:hypothetical protein